MTRLSPGLRRPSVVVLLLLVLCVSANIASSAESVGVLVVAHGGSKRWNRTVEQTVKQSPLALPTELAFGMGMHAHEVRQLQQAVMRLEAQGATRLVVVPLLVSSHSEVYRQYEYLFGLRPQAQWPEAGSPLEIHVPVVMGRALDDDPVVAEILLERAQAISRDPQHETVVLIAHGPNEDVDDQQWLACLDRLARQLKHDGGFAQVLSATIRDDAPANVQAQARQALRQTVQTASRQGRVLVVPVLMAKGGIEHKIPKLLNGLSYRYSGQTLLPHPKVAQWIAQYARMPSEGQPVVLK